MQPRRAILIVTLTTTLVFPSACEPTPAQNTMCRGLTVPNKPVGEQPQNVQLLIRAGLCPDPMLAPLPEPTGLPIEEVINEPEQEPDDEPEPDCVAENEAPGFISDVNPIFQKFACAGCHSSDPSSVAHDYRPWFDEDADSIYVALFENPAVLNFSDPRNALILTKPLYEDPPDHPNASFVDVCDPDYLTILTWIEIGVPY